MGSSSAEARPPDDGTKATAAPAGGGWERISGYGLAVGGRAWILRAETPDDLRAAFEEARRRGSSVVFRGSGASYGDASINTEHVVCDITGMNRILSWDPEEGIVKAEAGVTLEQLWRRVVADGYWPPVVTGTMTPTLAGAVSMNVHGKNCWHSGPIGDHIVELELMLPSGEIRLCGPERDAELFEAVVGGIGMLACVVSVTLRLKRIHSGLVEVLAIETHDLDAMFSYFEEQQDQHTYLVGWIDAFAGGRGLGRGLIHFARHLADGEDPNAATTLRPEAQDLPSRLFGVLPKAWMWRFLLPFTNNLGMRLVNAVKYWLGWLRDRSRIYRQTLGAFNFLLDYVPDWRLVYRPGGFIQHQAFVPRDTARATFRFILETAQRFGIPPYLVVFKRHRPDRFLLSHGLDGYSLAMDIPVTDGNRGRLLEMTRRFDEAIVEAGGRFYAAKDATLDGALFRRSLPPESIARFTALKGELDPENLLQSDLYRRLLLDGAHNPALLPELE